MSENLNEQQRNAIDSQENTVVQAGAGSGKTLVLAKRYARLVREGKADVERILTVTFTRKAAAEMYERIYSLLADQGEAEVQEQLERFDRAHISTLDSFCTSIVREWSPKFGLPPTFVQDENENRRIADEVALQFVLEHQHSEVIKRFIRQQGFEEVWKRFFADLALTYLPVGVERDFSAIATRQHAFLISRLQQVVDKLAEHLERIMALDGAAGKSVKKAHQVIGQMPALAPLLDALEVEKLVEAVAPLQTLRLVGNTKNPEILALNEHIKEVRTLKDEMIELAGTLALEETHQEMFALCERFQRRYHREKRRRGVLSYYDVQEMAVALLREYREIRSFYKQKFRYILIDEFQDNNRLQKELLYLLAEREELHRDGPGEEDLAPDKLFFVGDEKQSIYRFRGADVSVFRELSERFTGPYGKTISLTTNYRSAPGLVAFFNSFFREVLRDAREPYEARFEELGARSEGAHSAGSGAANETGAANGSRPASGTPPRIRFFYKPYEGDASSAGERRASPSGRQTNPQYLHSDDAEAFHIARYIKTVVEEQALPVTDPHSGEQRPAWYTDFALLMRSTSNQVKYERMFRRFGIPYVTQSVRTLFLEAPVNDLYNLLQLTVYPDDRLAYAGLLRSPLVHLGDEAVINLLIDGKPAFEDTPENTFLAQADREKYAAARNMYLDIKTRVDIAPLTELVQDLWYRYGYRYTVLKNPAFHSYLEFYDYLWSLAREADDRGEPLAVFLDFLRENLGKYERIQDIETLKDDPEGVQILTIHKSKGLEFPVVILANMGNTGNRGGDKHAPFHISEDHGLTFRTVQEPFTGGKKQGFNYYYNRAEEEERKREIAELKRLLYVGATRAEHHLIFSGVHNRNNRNDKNGPSCLLNIALDALGLDWKGDGGGQWLSNTGDGGGCASGIDFEQIEDITEEDLDRVTSVSKKPHLGEAVSRYRGLPVQEYPAWRREFSATDFDLGGAAQAAGGEAVGTGAPAPAGAPIAGQQATSVPHGSDSLESDRYLSASHQETAFGTLCHYILEQIIRRGSLWKPGMQIGTEEIPTSLLSPLPEEHIETFVRDGARMAAAFLQSHLGQLLQRAERVEPELSFLLRRQTEQGEQFINGRVDLYFEANDNGQGLAFVVDFKTDRCIDVEWYRERMRIYQEAVEALTEKPVQSYLFFLRHGEAVALGER